MDPCINSPLEYLFLLWPEFLSDLIVEKTNRYGGCKAMWLDEDSCHFLGW